MLSAACIITESHFTSTGLKFGCSQYTENRTKTVGGVLFIEPAKDGIGWASNPNEVYVKSYLQHGLQDIDAEAFERLKM